MQKLSVPGFTLASILLVGTCLLTSQSLLAESFSVDTTGDAIDIDPGDGVCATSIGRCSLRAAIQESNALIGADAIDLPAGSYPLTVGNIDEDAANEGDLDITDDVTISGAGSTTTAITGSGNQFRVFEILDNPTDQDRALQVHISGVSLTAGLENDTRGGLIVNRGHLSLDDIEIISAGLNTGAVYSPSGRLDITNSSFSNNRVAIWNNGSVMSISNSVFDNNTGADGAGIYHSGSGSTVVLNSTFTNNIGNGRGGAIRAEGGVVEIVGSTFTNNQSGRVGNTGLGGAIFANATMSIVDTRFVENIGNANSSEGGAIYNQGALFVDGSVFDANVTSQRGGAIANNFGQSWITNTAFSNNTSTDCGAVGAQHSNTPRYFVDIHGSAFTANQADRHGGALCASHNVTVRDSSFNQNTAISQGGAIYSIGDSVAIENSTLSANSAARGSAIFHDAQAEQRLSIRHVTFADNANTAGSGGSSIENAQGRVSLASSIVQSSARQKNCDGEITTLGFNVVGDSSCEPNTTTDLPDTDAQLARLGTGPNQTSEHIPLTTSVAVDLIPADTCPPLDQSLRLRNGLTCTAGAVETNGATAETGSIAFAATEYRVSELAGTQEIVISRQGGSDGEVNARVLVRTTGTASVNRDYRFEQIQNFFWADGDDTNKEFTLTIQDDFLEEPTESVVLTLLGVVGSAPLGVPSDTTVLILDDEAPADVSGGSTTTGGTDSGTTSAGTDGGTTTGESTTAGTDTASTDGNTGTSDGSSTSGNGSTSGVDGGGSSDGVTPAQDDVPLIGGGSGGGPTAPLWVLLLTGALIVRRASITRALFTNTK